MLTAINFIVTVLLWASLAWAVYRAHRRHRETDTLMKGVPSCIEDAKRAGAQARLLWHFDTESRSIERFLAETRDKWNYAGEHLVHPLSTETDWKDFGKDDASKLAGRLRDFRGMCASHLMNIRQEFPGLDTPFVTLGYPSNAEYSEVEFAIRDHSELLHKTAQSIWRSEVPREDLDAKNS
jgi:hypothetical protein